MATQRTLPADTALGRIALRVADIQATVDFYRDVVGFATHSRTDDRAALGVGGDALLELHASPGADERRGAGLFHAAIRYPTRDALGGALGRVRDRWHLDGAADHGVSEALYLTDPDGNGVELYRDRPRDAWPTAPDGRVRMGTEPLDIGGIAEAADGEPDAPAGTDVGHVHLEVTDLERARGFYVETLGLDVRQAMGDAALFLAAGDYHHHVGLNTWNGRTARASGRGLTWFELRVPEPEAIVAARERFADVGVAVVDRPDGIEMADPDGIRLRLVADSS